ncbi:GNAT family N-acetyltransferase [Kribbella sp. NPDC051586]|uniref:GNAT family N-acetyltransferase n=1 Tax=Kribbella sp. NPDC051586 TaxID=3364118 RepID=UPI003798045E
MTPADYGAVLALNSAAIGLVDPLGPDRLDWLRLIAAHAAVIDVDDEPAGFLLTFTPGSAYDGLEFDWFTQTYADRFLLIERIVVAPEHRREGIGSQVYRAIERAAKPFDRAVARVRSHPLDASGLSFHTARGYTEIAKQRLPEGTTAVLLSKELAD